MKHFVGFLIAIGTVVFLYSLNKENRNVSPAKTTNLRVYSYSSFTQSWGPGPLLKQKFKESHKEKYKTMSRFAHPNIESLNMHLGKTSDQQFEFLTPTINLILWHSVAIIKLFADFKLLDLDKNIDQGKLLSLQSDQNKD